MNAIKIMEQNAINHDKVDWSEIKKNASEKAKTIYTKQEAHRIIKNILPTLEDNHSLFISPKKTKKIYSKNKKIPIISDSIYNDLIGYIRIPSFIGNDSLANVFASDIKNKILNFDKSNIQNYIIDLRTNTGGNMWPMLLGLSPLLDNGTVGYFVDRNKNYIPWISKNKVVYIEKRELFTFEEKFSLKNKPKRIAILIGRKTCSSAEAITIAFIGQKNTKLIGGKTCGRTTSNNSFRLSDGAILAITTSTFANRNKKIYGHEITPDLYSAEPKKDAIAWILKDFKKD